MNRGKTNWAVVVGCAIVVGTVLVACLWLAWWAVAGRQALRTPRYGSNGAQMYFTATSQGGTPITYEMTGMGMMGQRRLACVSCHGAEGRGGQVRMMMYTFRAPDIRYGTLTSDKSGEEGTEEHEPYTEETIKRAITEGVEPNGEKLEWPMPRWQMVEADLDDLVGFLKTLR